MSMHILVILAHPNNKSLNHAIAQVAMDKLKENGHHVIFHDLYREQFDPLLTTAELYRGADLPPQIKQHCAALREADGIVIVHPNWWSQPPAILKGWVDRVFRAGVAYEFVEIADGVGEPRGLLKAKQALVFNTYNAPATEEDDPLDALWRHSIFPMCGVKKVQRRVFNMVINSTEAERKQWLEVVRADIDRYFPIAKE